MSRQPVIVSVDQGTSATKAIVVNEAGAIIAKTSVSIGRADPAPGWVEQNAAEIRDSAVAAINQVLSGLPVDVRGVGLSNQRESALLWDLVTGELVGPMLGWQDRRTSSRVAQLAARGWQSVIREKTGLPLDPMFSALKVEWLLDTYDKDRSLARAGRLAVGTIDSWLVYSLTGEHRIELGNASRTQLLNLGTLDWDDALLDLFNIPRKALPRIAASTEPTREIRGIESLPAGTKFYGILGDSHSALYAHGARSPGAVKSTYGTGNSIMGLIGGVEEFTQESSVNRAAGGVVCTIAWGTPEPMYAFEGTILSTGSTLVWLANLLDLEPSRLSELAQLVDDSQGVDLVPAFAGLGAPWWDEQAAATISGFGLGTGRAQLARAAFESTVLQTEDVIVAAERHLGMRIQDVLVDGGPTQNSWLMQLQADLSQRAVIRSNTVELSAIGVAHLAGISSGLWNEQDVAKLPRDRTTFQPAIPEQDAVDRQLRWLNAIARSRFQTS